MMLFEWLFPHFNRDPWRRSPPWAKELKRMGFAILANQEKQMSALNDLDNAVGALVSGFAALDAAVQTELTALIAALEDDSPETNERINQAVANISRVTGKMAEDAAALSASIPAATTIPPPDTTPVEVPVEPDVTPPVIEVPVVTDPNATPPT